MGTRWNDDDRAFDRGYSEQRRVSDEATIKQLTEALATTRADLARLRTLATEVTLSCPSHGEFDDDEDIRAGDEAMRALRSWLAGAK